MGPADYDHMTKIAGLLRVKNEARWIEAAIESIRPVCDPILVLDDHSTDGTPELCERAGAIVHRSTFEGVDEARDKDLLLSMAREHKAEWCFSIDGDELIEATGPALIRAAAESGVADSYSFRFLYLWDRPDQIRTDGVYSRMTRHSMFRVRPGQRFMRTQFGGNFHCGSVPESLVHLPPRSCAARILHLGYMLREDRIRKYEWYNRLDPNNATEDRYKHMVVGDLFPADSRFRWGGPLKLEALCAPAA
jgi:O-antigen biosynthesis protein